MAVYEVFSCSVIYKYKSSVCSKATIFIVLTALVTYISPLLLAYRSYGFWLQSDSYSEQPNIRFKHQFLLIAETSIIDSSIICSNFHELNKQIDKQSQCSAIKTKELDLNKDGKVDEIEFESEIQLDEEEDIFGIKLLLLFDYRLSALCHLHMEGAAFIQHVSPLPGSKIEYMADMYLVQKNPLMQLRGTDTRYNTTIFGDPKRLQSYHLPTVLREYSKRNVTTRLQNDYTFWEIGRAHGDPFTLKIRLSFPEQNVVYRPGFWQIMKWAWLQYFALLVIIKTGTESLKHWVFSQHVVPVVKMPPPWIKPY